MARPRKPDLERRSNRLTLYLTTVEVANLEAKARKVDRQLAVYARDAVLEGKVIARHGVSDDRVFAALTRIGVNLNQLTRHVNRNKRVSVGTADRLNALLSRIDRLTNRVDTDGT